MQSTFIVVMCSYYKWDF